jgi:integrase/recombinase XerD
MLTSIEAYLALRRAVGFRLMTEERLLHDFARWASAHGDTHVRTQTAPEWAAAARSSWQRERRLRAVSGFARHARAEDPRHEVPPIFVFGRRHVRPRPHIYSPDELRRLLNAASRSRPSGRCARRCSRRCSVCSGRAACQTLSS